VTVEISRSGLLQKVIALIAKANMMGRLALVIVSLEANGTILTGNKKAEKDWWS